MHLQCTHVFQLIKLQSQTSNRREDDVKLYSKNDKPQQQHNKTQDRQIMKQSLHELQRNKTAN